MLSSFEILSASSAAHHETLLWLPAWVCKQVVDSIVESLSRCAVLQVRLVHCQDVESSPDIRKRRSRGRSGVPTFLTREGQEKSQLLCHERHL